MEDRQPNEVRLDRKGKSTIPAIKFARSGGHHESFSFRGFDSSQRRLQNRPFNQNTLGAPLRNRSNNLSSVSSLNVSYRSFDHVNLEPSGNSGQSDERPPKRTKFGSEQFLPGDNQTLGRHFQRRRLPRANVTLDLPSQCLQGIRRNYGAHIVLSRHDTLQNRTVVRNVIEAAQSESSSGRSIVRKQPQRDQGVTATHELVMGHASYSRDCPEVIPIENTRSSPARASQPTTTTSFFTCSLSELVSHSHTPDQPASSRTQNFATPGKQTTLPSRAAPPTEDTIDLTVDLPDIRVNIPVAIQTRFFRSGVLKIKPVSSKPPSAMYATSAAESIVLQDNDSDNDFSARELISGEGNFAIKPRKDGIASFRTLRDGLSEPLLPIHALVFGRAPGRSRAPLVTHDKPRCVLSADWISSLVGVSMRGFVESLDMSSLVFQRNLRRPVAPAQEFVDDACILHAGNTSIVILAHARVEKQISYLTFQSCKESGLHVIDRPWNKMKKGGTSAVSTMMQPLMFASGGYDHAVHVWNFSEDITSVSSTLLPIKHASVIQSLLPIRDTSHKLISASADCNVHLWDLSSERVVHTFKTSNSPYHAHKTESPFCTLLEVGHRDLQFELRDHRMVPELPAQRFGFYITGFHGRFVKGDTWSHFFASGSRNGVVRLWDLRKVREQSASISCFNNDQVVQVLKTDSDLLAFSKRGAVMTLNTLQNRPTVVYNDPM